jgi:hypothetical protein
VNRRKRGAAAGEQQDQDSNDRKQSHIDLWLFLIFQYLFTDYLFAHTKKLLQYRGDVAKFISSSIPISG